MARSVYASLRALIRTIRLTTLEMKLDIAICALERRYREDQPRAPQGTPEGGQWIEDRVQQQRGRTRTALAAILLTQRVGLGDIGLVRHCIYEDYFGRQFTIELNAAILCSPT